MMTMRRGRTASLIPEDEDEVRIEKVHALRQEIAAGTYAVAAEQVALRVIEEAMVER
jgi:anti-sigma28 factor (negative regulator of flagellin synthesis)